MTAMPDIERQGARIHYQITGDGPAVLLGHSLLGDGRMWERVAPTLTERYRVIVVDTRGHRNSTAAGAFTLDDLADDWLAILNAEQVDQAALCGISMGGMIAMNFALAHPTRVAALALLNTSADRDPRAIRVQFRLMAETVRHVGFVRPLINTIAAGMFGRTARRTQVALVEQELDRVREKDRDDVYWAVRAVTDRTFLRPRLDAVTCPTRVIVGSEDTTTPPVLSRRITAAVTGARMVTLPAIGHLSVLEAPEAVADALREFLDPLRWS